MFTKASIAVAVLSAVAISAPASAATFNYTNTNFSGGVANKKAGVHKLVDTTYDDVTHEFSWTSTIARNPRNGRLADSAWLVISGGPNPKGIDNELAIFYLDGDNGKVSIYNYNGVNGSNSWEKPNPQLLGSTTLLVDNSVTDERGFSFNIDMTAINNLGLSPDWKGTSFGEEIGIWYHAADNSNFTYNTAGEIASYTFAKQSYYDTAYKKTHKIPEPGSLAALGLFAAAAAAGKLRDQSHSA